MLIKTYAIPSDTYLGVSVSFSPARRMIVGIDAVAYAKAFSGNPMLVVSR